MKQYIKSNNSIFKTIINYYIALIPLILYGLYKNGIFLYNKGLVNFFGMLKPLIICLISLILSYFIEYLFLKDKNKIKNSFLPLYGLLIIMMLPNLSYLLYLIIILISNIILKLLMKLKISINKIALVKLLMVGLLILLNNYSYQNIYETSKVLNYSFIDIFTGYNIGGICSNNILFILYAYLFLGIDKTYKKEIPFYILISYFSLKIIYALITSDTSIIVNSLLNSNLIFGIIFISSLNDSSPLRLKHQIIYGCVVGILTFILDFITINESIYISILIMSLVNNFKPKIKNKHKK